MFRKDIRHILRLLAMPLLMALIALFFKIFQVSWQGYSETEIVTTLFMCNFMFVIPIVAFLGGMTLFQQENWELVWTMPLSRGNVLTQKLSTGFLFILLGTILSFLIFALSHIPDISAILITTCFLIAVGSFLLGVVAGLSTPTVFFGVMFTAAGVCFSFLLWNLLSFPDLSGLYFTSYQYFGQSICLFWTCLIIIFLTASVVILFARQRLYKPLQNVVLGASLLTISVVAFWGVTAIILDQAMSALE